MKKDIALKNLSLLERLIDIHPSNIPQNGLNLSSTSDSKLKSLSNMIAETGLDYIINERMNKVGIEEVDENLEEIQNAYYKLISNLKKLGYIEIHGIQVRPKRNI